MGHDEHPRVVGAPFAAHPWHGVSLGDDAPEVVTAYIEIVPTDTVKYELDKASGLLRVDRPQRYSNVIPSLYGLLPRTLCAERVAARCTERVGGERAGDGDPLDICVLTERVIAHRHVLVDAVPVGGLRMIDKGEVDDKIISVLRGDAVFGSIREVADLPPSLLERLRHYFLTYKQPPDGGTPRTEIAEVYGREEAHEMIRLSRADYDAHYATVK